MKPAFEKEQKKYESILKKQKIVHKKRMRSIMKKGFLTTLNNEINETGGLSLIQKRAFCNTITNFTDEYGKCYSLTLPYALLHQVVNLYVDKNTNSIELKHPSLYVITEVIIQFNFSALLQYPFYFDLIEKEGKHYINVSPLNNRN